jgi:splicing factor 3A subunit 3
MERIRILLEEKERLRVNVEKELIRLSDAKSAQSRLRRESRVLHWSRRLALRSERLDELATDPLILDEMRSRGHTRQWHEANVFASFYNSVRAIRQFHENGESIERQYSATAAAADNCDRRHVAYPRFTAAECVGACLDLHEFYRCFLNLPSSKTRTRKRDLAQFAATSLDYLGYLSVFDKFDDDDDDDHAYDQVYRDYVLELRDYLVDFVRRTRPLFDVERFASQVSDAAGDDDAAASPPLFCNACQRTFAKSVTFEAHLAGKRHVRAAKRAQARAEQRRQLRNAKATIAALAQQQHLVDAVEATRIDVQKRQSRLPTTSANDGQLSDASSSDSGSDDDGDLPARHVEADEEQLKQMLAESAERQYVADDGTPVPAWLYRKEGMRHEYQCEICSNETYRGHKSFERHFSQALHARGLRALGIPNTSEFHHITRIEDAMRIHAAIKAKVNQLTFNPAQQEQFEDSNGHLFTKSS